MDGGVYGFPAFTRTSPRTSLPDETDRATRGQAQASNPASTSNSNLHGLSYPNGVGSARGNGTANGFTTKPRSSSTNVISSGSQPPQSQSQSLGLAQGQGQGQGQGYTGGQRPARRFTSGSSHATTATSVGVNFSSSIASTSAAGVNGDFYADNAKPAIRGLLVPTDRTREELEDKWLPRLGKLRVDREVELAGYSLYSLRTW
jgi:hypothetical protein